MARRRSKVATHTWLEQIGVTCLSAAGQTGYGTQLFDLSTLLETLVGQGEEVVITKALLRYECTVNSVYFHSVLALLVAGDAIAAAYPTGGVLNGARLADELDPFTAGEYEFQILEKKLSNKVPEATSVYKTRGVVDCTQVVAQAARLLAHSTLLETGGGNPKISIVCFGRTMTANTTPYVYATLELEYGVRAKPIRMLGV